MDAQRGNGPFESLDDIANMEDLGPTVGIAGYIGDVFAGLRKLGKPIPTALDYPPELTEFLGRRIWSSTLGAIRATTTPTFVKPVEQKAFTGFVWTADRESRMRIVTHADDVPVWCAEPVSIVSEYRTMILRGELVGCRHYRGDWSKAPSRDVVEAAVRAKGPKAASAYCLDWGVIESGRTILIEENDGFAFGHYGLHPVMYARMLSARWFELAS